MTTFAYVLMTYRNAGQVSRLVARLRELSPDAVLLVRHDARLSLSKISAVRQRGGTPRISVRDRLGRVDHGRSSAHRVAVAASQHRRRLHHLPLRPGLSNRVPRRLGASGHRDTSRSPGRGEANRVPPQMAQAWRRRSPRPASNVPLLPREDTSDPRPLKLLGPVVDTQRLPYSDQTLIGLRSPLRGLKLWWSLPWVTLSCEAADAVLAAGADPKLSARFKRAFIPEESFIPTVLSNRGIRIIEARSPTAVSRTARFTRLRSPSTTCAS